jgi:hypothetical protein
VHVIMKARRNERGSRLWRWLGQAIDRLVIRLKTIVRARRSARAWWRPPSERADERTLRRQAEREGGGLSSRESVARYERGENPGGLHHKAIRREGPEHPRHHPEEPRERKEKVPGGVRHIPVMRRGS